MKNYVIVLARPYVNSVGEFNGKVLLIEKQKPEFQRLRYNLPGGAVEEGESYEEAAIRELKEETGLDPIGKVEWMGIIKSNDCRIWCYCIPIDYVQPLAPREGEIEKVEWWDWNTVKETYKLMPNLQVIIPLMLSEVYGWEIIDDKDSRGKTSHDFSITVSTRF